MKKIYAIVLVVLSCAFFYAEEYEYPKMDMDLKIYLPSLNGIVFGENSAFSKFNESPNPTNSYTVTAEGRSDLFAVGNFSFSWAFGVGIYTEDYPEKEDESRVNFGLTLGIGVYANHWSRYSQTGPCLYLYPMYQFPVYVSGGSPYWDWKFAADIGWTFKLGFVTIYPYCRGILALHDWKAELGFDAGVALGLYFPDPNY